jgi:TP901 family phage tail tape measure protein
VIKLAGMDDSLKIILSASLEEGSITEIRTKLEKLKKDFKNIKIKLELQGNVTSLIEKLMKNIEALNTKLSKLTDQQLKDLKKVGEQAEKNAEAIKGQEQAKPKKVADDDKNLLKTRTKYNTETGEPVEQTKTYGDKFNKRTVAKNLETGETLSDIENIENEKIRKEAEKRDKLLKEFLQNQQKYQAELDRLYEKGYSKKGTMTAPLRKALKNQPTEEQIFGTKENPKADYEERYQKALKETEEQLKKVLAYEKNIADAKKARPEMEDRRNVLKDKGYNVESINKMIAGATKWQQSSEEMQQGIKQVNEELARMEKHDKTFASLEAKARKLGITIDQSFKIMGTEDLAKFQERIATIQKQINDKKKEGTETTRREVAEAERLLQVLQRDFEERQRINKELNEKAQHRNKIKGDEVQQPQFAGENVREVFNDTSALERAERARDLARAYTLANTEATHLNTATADLRTTQDDLGREQYRVTYQFRDLQGVLQRQTVVIDQTTGAMYNLGQATVQTGGQANNVTNIFDNLSNSFARVPAYLASFGLVYEAFNQIQQSFRILYEVDEAMTNLAKVTDATTQQFEAFRLEASNVAQQLGATTVEVAKAVTDFQRLGYTFQESKGLGETALVYANVGDMDIEHATSAIISSLKGFNVAQRDSVEESERYLDIFNEVGNNFAISSAGIGEAMKRSSASLYEAGNDVEQAVAMITAANAVIQDEKKVGTAMKTISMRLRGIDEETGKVSKTVPQLGEQFREAGVDIMASADTFKSTYEIMNELAQVWNTGALSDMQKASLVEAIGGKHHGTVVSAMLNNWTDATNALATAHNSAGSSAREFAKYQESLVFRVDRLKASYEEFWLTFWDNEAIKTAVDGLNLLLNALTKVTETFGSLSVITFALVPPFLLLSKTIRNTFLLSVADIGAFRQALDRTTTTMTAFQRATTMAGVAVRTLGKALLVGLALSAVIGVIGFAYDKTIGSQKKYLDQLTDEYERQSQLLEVYKNVDVNRYAELQTKQNTGGLNPEELNEYKSLQDSLIQSGEDVISHYNEQGEAVLISADALIKLNEERREELALIRERKVEEEKRVATEGEGLLGWANKHATGLGKWALDEMDLQPKTVNFDESLQEAQDTKTKLEGIKKEIDSVDLVKDVISESDLNNVKANSKEFNAEMIKVREKLNEMRNSGKISEDIFQQASQSLNRFTPSDAGFEPINVDLDKIVYDLRSQTDKVNAELKDTEFEISSQFDELKGTLADDFSNFIDANDIDLESDAGEFAKELEDSFYDALKGAEFGDAGHAISNMSDTLTEAFNTLRSNGINFEEVLTGQPEAIAKMEALLSQFTLTNENMLYGSDQYVLIANMVAQANNNITASEMGMLQNPVAEYRAQLSTLMADYNSEMTVVAEAIKMVNDGESLEIDQVNQLLELYPQLNGQVMNNVDGLFIKSSALMQVMADEEVQVNNSLEGMKALAESKLEEVRAFLKGDISKVKSLGLVAGAMNKAVDQSIEGSATIMTNAEMARLAIQHAGDPGKYHEAINANRFGGIKAGITADMRAQAKRMESDLVGFISSIEALMAQNKSANIRNKVDPPKKAPAPKKTPEAKKAEEIEILTYVTDEYKAVMRELNMQIKAQQEIMNEYPEYSKEYQKGLREEIALIGKKIKATEKEEKSLESQIANRKMIKTGLISSKDATGGGGGTYTVQRGDTLSEIAKKYKTNYQAIAKANNIANANRLSVGQVLRISGATGGGGGGGGITRNLRYGSTGEDVKKLQRALGITADGIFGNQTANALRNYQRSKGLSVDAIAGVKTLGAMGLWGAGGGVDTQNAQAKLEEELEKGRDELEKLQAERIALRKEANDKSFELVQSEVARLDRESKLLEDDLAGVDFIALKLDENTEAWRKNREERLEFLNTQAKANADSIAFLEEEIQTAENILNEKLEDKVYDMLQEQKIKYMEMQQRIYEESQAIAESVINEIVETYERDISVLDRKISELQNASSRLAEGDLDKYAIVQEDIRETVAKQIEVTNERLEQLKDEEESVKEFPELYKEWQSQVEDLTQAQSDLNQVLWDTQKELLDTHEGAIDELIEYFQEYYEARQEMEIEALEATMEKEEEMLDKRIENYEKDYEAFEKNISKQLEALEKAEDERAYQRDIGDRQKSRQEIIDMIGLVSLDTSAQGKQRLRQLQEELKTITDEISEMQIERRLANRQEALEKELEARANETDKLVEAEENRLEKEEEELDKHIEEVERKWENLIENERLFAQMREDLLAGNVEEMASLIDGFVQNIADSSEEMGESISQNLIDNFINARKELVELDKVLTESQVNFNDLYNSNANRITSDMIHDIPMANPLASVNLANQNNIPTNQTLTGNIQNVQLTVNIDTVQGGQEGADQFINAVTNGLARKGVTI